ncbi:MAG: hypothetical protein LJE69_09455 [Thiohalocapsa sp.]|uniref:asparagine synthetase B family protein n=1 Tax=Thiohalocapsa sp. TaxID=2497641 RepID=UPI0025DF2CBE|nr:asparagine synthase-related protein [Thiohalocapsa sp.]MCG6941464.1 hypothetical protein [Thiohalocapsa sp.]
MFIGRVLQRHDNAPAGPDRERLNAALAADCRSDLDGLFAGTGAWLYEQRVFNHAANRDTELPRRCPATGVVLTFWGRLDNRDDLIARLGRDATAAPHPPTDADLVLAAWRRWGEALPEHLLGDFALAVLNPLRRSVFLARDPLGVKPLYYVQHAGGFTFATSVAALRFLGDLDLTPDTDWMARYLLQLSYSDRQTAYREILKLLPGHCLILDAAGHQRLRAYHAWRDDAPAARRRDPRWVAAYRSVLEEAIRCRMPSDFPLGAENSGGIDSATVTAFLAHFLGEPGDRLHSFGFATCEQEPGFILETSRAKGVTHNYVITAHGASEHTSERIDRALRSIGYPEEGGIATDHLLFYAECAKRGIRTLFSGFGGDEVVTNPGNLLRYELLDSRDYASLWDILPGNPLRRALRLVKASTIGRRSPAYNRFVLDAWEARWPYQLLRPEVIAHLDLHRAYIEFARYDAPYRRINAFILDGLLRMSYMACRFEACSLLARSFGVEYRWPLCDARLVQQYLSTPSLEKFGPEGIGRYLHRRAIDGVVPPMVAWKPTKDMGQDARHDQLRLPRMAAAAERLRELEADLHPTLAGIIDRAKLRRQIKAAVQGDGAEYFGYMFDNNVRAIRWLDAWLKGEAH